ncbi:TPR repeat [Lachnospiraceae bacterium KM106-2]|nr:TPR repeat [Lachnospiraceae bacterium KM106-2]
MKYRKLCILLSATILAMTGCSSNNASGHYKSGMELFDKGQYEQASEDFAEAIKQNGDRAEYYIAYGMSLVKLKKYDEAVVQFDKVIMKHENQIVHENNKKAYRGKGIAYYEAQKYDKAQKEFEKALKLTELSDLNSDLYLYLGDCQIKNGDYKGAIATYNELIAEDKSEATYYVKRANAYQLLGKSKEAIADYDKAIEYDDDNYDIYFGKYFMLLAEGDKSGASEVLTQALAIKNDEADLFNIARIHYYQKDYNNALSEFNNVSSKNANAYFYIGQIYYSKKDYTNAKKSYEKYIKKVDRVQEVSVYNQLAMCELKNEEYEKAYQYVEKGLSYQDASLAKVLSFNEVICLEKIGEYDKAYKKAVAYMEKYNSDKEMKKELEFLETRVGE